MKKILGWVLGILSILVIGSMTAPTQSDNTYEQAEPVSNIATTESSPTVTETPKVESATTEPVINVPEPEPTPAPVAPTKKPASNCDPNYSPCVPNVSYDLDCGDISFSVTVTGTDHHRFDRDGDGYGCESN